MIDIPKSNFIPKSNILADMVFLFHIFVVLFIVFVPFLSVSPVILILHIVSCISLFTHWLANSDVCSLTILEGQLRGIDRTNTFTHQFISPVYQISSTEWSNIIWTITFIVMCVSIYKLYNTEKFKMALKCYNSEKFSIKHTMHCLKPLFTH